jgi:hypothetical protein
MGELEGLLLVVGIIYLSECVVWVRRGAMAFGNWWGKSFRIRHPGTLAGNQRGGLVLANPLPPLGGIFIVAQFPVSLSPEGAFAYVASCLNPAGRPVQSAKYASWDDLQSIEIDGRKIFAGGAEFLTAVSTFSARQTGNLLGRLRKLPRSERVTAIHKELSASLDITKVSERLREYRMRSKSIRILSNLLFIYLFLVVPPLIWRFGFGVLGLYLMWGMLAQTVAIAILFRRAHEALYPDAREDRFKPFLTMLLAPPAAIRAPDVLGRHLLETFHPLGVARIVCSPKWFRDFAHQTLIDLHYPLFPVCPATESAPIETERWFREATLAEVEEFLKKEGLKARELVAAPQPIEPANLTYCPRCGTQFVTHEGTCADCGGRPLQMFQRG